MCSDKEIKVINFWYSELPNIDYSEGEVLIFVTAGLNDYEVKRATEAAQIASEIIKQVIKDFEDMNSILPFNLMKDTVEKIRIYKAFKEKPQKRNFVNKFNKNQHRKK